MDYLSVVEGQDNILVGEFCETVEEAVEVGYDLALALGGVVEINVLSREGKVMDHMRFKVAHI